MSALVNERDIKDNFPDFLVKATGKQIAPLSQFFLLRFRCYKFSGDRKENVFDTKSIS